MKLKVENLEQPTPFKEVTFKTRKSFLAEEIASGFHPRGAFSSLGEMTGTRPGGPGPGAGAGAGERGNNHT